MHAAPIRDAQGWTGTPHPQLGNSLNMRVRDAAKEALDEVFKQGPSAQSGAASSAAAAAAAAAAASGGNGNLRGRIQGYGSTTGRRIVNSYAEEHGLANSGSGGAGGRGKFGGFGSEDVRAAEAAGGNWRSAAQGYSVRCYRLLKHAACHSRWLQVLEFHMILSDCVAQLASSCQSTASHRRASSMKHESR